jgi:Transglycosylase SLT domain
VTPHTSFVVSWIIILMEALQADAPWKSSYEQTARAIASVVEAKEPIFDGEQGREKTAALLVAVAWAESRFNPKAVGDQGKSVGLYQIFHTNLPTPEGFRQDDILGHPNNATIVAYRMLRYSMNACEKVPFANRLGAYTGGTCTGEKAVWQSKYRLNLAKKVFDEHAPESAQAGTSWQGSGKDETSVPVIEAPKPPAVLPDLEPAAPPAPLKAKTETTLAARPPQQVRKAERRARAPRAESVPDEPIDESKLPPIRLTRDEVARIEGKRR